MHHPWIIIVNPTAGSGKGRQQWSQVQQQLEQQGMTYEVAWTTHAQHAMDLAEQAVHQGYRCIAAMGGDGTAHEVVNGLCRQQQVPSQDLVFALLPVGTGNDWIKTHGIPNDCRAVLALMQAGRTLLHDIGYIHYHNAAGQPQSRYFLNVAGLGYDAFVTKASNERRRFGSNTFTYFYLILSCLLRYRPPRMRVTLDHEVVEGAIFSMAVGQGRYNGGGAQFVPHALPDDGRVAVTAFQDISTWEVVRHTPKFYDGTITSHPKAIDRQVVAVQVAPLLGARPALIEADGEYLGQVPARFEMLPKALRVVVP